MPGPGSETSPRIPLPPASIASATGPPGPCLTALVTSSVTIISARQRSSAPTWQRAAASRTASRARAGAWDVAGSSRRIAGMLGPYPDRGPLRVDSLANNPLHLAAVRAALRCPHHSADDRPYGFLVPA